MDQAELFNMAPRNQQLTGTTFLEHSLPGNATLTYHDDSGKLSTIHNLNLQIIERNSPLLALAFENSRSGPQLHLETVNPRTILPFLRCLYTGSYALSTVDGYCYPFDEVPTSLLFHSQMFRLGDIHDLPVLKQQAYVNVLRQCEFGCSSPDKPIDLCAAIKFLYNEQPKYDGLIHVVVNYCVSCFIGHKLAQDPEFQQLSRELRLFHQDLFKLVRNRGFEDETAAAIIQLPFMAPVPATPTPRLGFDDVFHFHGDDGSDDKTEQRKSQQQSEQNAMLLPLRLRIDPRDKRRETSGGRAPPGSAPGAVKTNTSVEMKQDAETQVRSATEAPATPSHLPTEAELKFLAQLPTPPEQDFEMVNVPPHPLVDSDSEGENFVAVRHEDGTAESEAQAGPNRFGDSSDCEPFIVLADDPELESELDSDSDTDWSMV